MLSQKILNVVKIPKNVVLYKPNVFPLCTSAVLKERLKSFEELQKSKNRSLVSDDYVDKDNIRRPFFEVDMDAFKLFHNDFAARPDGIMYYLKEKTKNWQLKYQKFDIEKVKLLGYDIAAGYFIVHQEGKVKFKGRDWLSMENYKSDPLPQQFDPSYVLTEFDLSDVLLHYEGLENFQNLPRIKRAIFARSPLFDDWYSDKVASLLINLEYLDISECPKVTERSLEAFYKLYNLKTLRITNYSQTAAFELTCMMLEDVLPNLKIEILEPPKKEDVNKK